MFTWSLEAAEGDCDPRHTLDFRPSVLGTQKGPCGRKAWQPPWGRKGGKEWRRRRIRASRDIAPKDFSGVAATFARSRHLSGEVSG